MRRLSLLAIALLVPALLLLTVTSGCGKKPQKDGGTDDEDKLAATGAPRGEGGTPKTDGSTGGATRAALKAETFDGVIKGQVIYDGSPQEGQIIEAMKTNNDAKHCLSAPEAQKISQRWIVNKKNNGVANVVVFLKPPDGHYFPMDKSIALAKEVSIDQPFCAFEPHVQVAFPFYFDGKKYVPSGQVFKIKNSAPVPHNTKVSGDDKDVVNSNLTLKPREEGTLTFFRPARKPINLNCSFHPWMNAMIWTFDHPYAAITDENGNFQIKSVPTGVQLSLGAWHESVSSTQLRTFHEQKVNLTKGQTLEIPPLKIKAAG